MLFKRETLLLSVVKVSHLIALRGVLKIRLS